MVADRLSTTLHESVILRILSFLPTADAVRTMLISKYFTTLWTNWLPSLHLEDNCHADDGDDAFLVPDLRFLIFVRNLLKHHKAPKIDRFTVNLSIIYYSDIVNRNLGHEVESWINFALRKQVNNLEFRLNMHDPEEDLLFKFPSELISDSVVELKLEYLDMNSLSRIQLRSLRILRLITVEISDGILGEIISCCPSLKELEIHNCYGLKQVSSPNVKKLTVDISFPPEDLEINCPNLKSFDFTGFVDRVEIKNLLSLIDVTYNLSFQSHEFKEFPKFITLVKKFVCAERVSFSTEFVQSIEAQSEDDVLQIEDCWRSLKCITLRNVANSSYPILVRLTELLLRKASDLNQLVFHYGGRKIKASDLNQLVFHYGGTKDIEDLIYFKALGD